ncbi:MAG: MFS family permease/Sugar phosphate permease [Chloroflexi bacterium]|jgi:EmrB/QacA subfamily drug resistance transporter|nr:MAG: MFS family permease/Sugar phosphate permease [Chloroflexota bacterium]
MAQPPPAPGDEHLIEGASVAGVPYRWVALALVCTGVYLSTLDASIVNIALPTLSREFDTAPSNVIWVSLIFIIVNTGLALTLGRLGDIYGRKHLYVMGFAVFTLAAGLSALAGSLPELLATRALQAIGSAAVLANGAAIVTATFPASQRGRALGIQVATVGAGVASGPVLGGILVDVLDWRAIFWTRVPLGVLGSLLVWRFLVDTPPASRPRGMDIPGSIILFGMLSSLVLAVNRGQAWGWSSPEIVSLFTIGSVLLVTFVFVERRSVSPVVDLALFKLRSYSASITAAMLQFFGLSAVIILGPFYLVDARGFSTLEAGGIIAAFPLAMLLISPFSGALSDRVGARIPTTFGLVLVCGALLFLSTLDVDTSVLGIVVRLFLVGAGTAIFSSPNTATIMSSVPRDRLGTASASQTTARTIGNAIGVAVSVAIFTSQAAAFAGSRSELGLDDPTIGPQAMVSGLQLALQVATVVVAFAIPASLLRGATPKRPLEPAPTPPQPVSAATGE